MSRFSPIRFLTAHTRDEGGFTLASVAAATAVAGASATVILPAFSSANAADAVQAFATPANDPRMAEDVEYTAFLVDKDETAPLPPMTVDAGALSVSAEQLIAVDQQTRTDAEALLEALQTALKDDPAHQYVVSAEAYDAESRSYKLTTEWGQEAVSEVTKSAGSVVFVSNDTSNGFTLKAYNNDGGQYNEYGNHLEYNSVTGEWSTAQTPGENR